MDFVEDIPNAKELNLDKAKEQRSRMEGKKRLKNCWLMHLKIDEEKSFQILNMNTGSLRKHYEEIEALIACLEQPACIKCLAWLEREKDINLLKKGNERLLV